MVEMLERAAKKQEKEARSWMESPGDVGKKDAAAMSKMLNNDAKDIRHIAALLRKGRFDQAYSKIWDMDTCAREAIPQTVDDFILRWSTR